MNNIKILILVLVAFQQAYSQSNWNVSGGLQFQFSRLESDSSFLDDSSDYGTAYSLGLSYNLSDNWSIHTGVGLGVLQTVNEIENFSDIENTTDSQGENFEFRYTVSNYRENQKSTIVTIPLALQYETRGEDVRFYSKLGGKLYLFINPKSNANAELLETTGFFERFNGELSAPEFIGFGSFTNVDFSEQDVEIKNSINITLEFGVKQKIADKQWIYMGLFVEQGVNNILETSTSSLVEYNTTNPTDFIANSSLNASSQLQGAPFADKLNLRVVGVKLTYEFSNLK